MRILLFVLALVGAQARADTAGDFDYFVLALSWNPTWCAVEGDRRDADQCDARHDLGWTLHGLWPQYTNGFPEYCTTTRRDPSRRQSDAMADIMGSGGLAWHQWKKHGRCTGLSGADYYAASRLAYGRIARPSLLRDLNRPVALPARLIEEAFIEVNPDIPPDGLTVTCRDGRIHEVRICLTRGLEPRPCGADVRLDCTLPDALFEPIR